MEKTTLTKGLFLGRKPKFIDEDRFGQYATLIPLVKKEREYYLLFEKRSSALRHQPGEICFPGGRLEEGESLLECAIRESMEELLIQKEQISIFGETDIYLSPFHIMVHPFLGELHGYDMTYSKEEVDYPILIPLSFFLETKPSEYGSTLVHQLPEDFPYELIPNGADYPWAKGKYEIIFYQYQKYTIWGMTAKMLQAALPFIYLLLEEKKGGK